MIVEMRVERDNYYVYPFPGDDQTCVEVYGEDRCDAVRSYLSEGGKHGDYITVVDFSKGFATDHLLDGSPRPSKVIPILGAQLPVEGAEPELIEMLEELLSRARGGDIRSMAYAIETRRGGEIQTSWWRGTGAFSATLLGAVGYLQCKMAAKMRENET